MRIEVLYESVYVSDVYYQIEKQLAFNEIEALSPQRLSLELLCLEEQEDELIDGYDSGTARNMLTYSDQTDCLLEIWKVKMRIELVKLRLSLYTLFDGVYKVKSFTEMEDDEMNGLSDAFASSKLG